MAKDCEQPDKCRKCGEEGHKSNDCETGFKTQTREVLGEDGEMVKREIYVPPPEASEDSLFELGIACGINFEKFDKIPVKVSGENAPSPIPTFESMGSFGTEDRPTDRPFAPRDEVYEYIIYRGTDIKDIRVCQPPKPQPTLEGGLPNDPAIVQVSWKLFVSFERVPRVKSA